MQNASVTKTILSVRVSPDEHALLEAAAAQSRTTLSEFVRRKAVEAAEAEVLDRRVIVIPATDWERFEAWIGRPAVVVPALAELAGRRPTWES